MGVIIYLDMDDIIFLLDDWDAEDYVDAMSTDQIIGYYALKFHSQYIDNPMYMDALSCEHA